MIDRMHIAVLDEELPFPLTSGKRIRTFHLLSRLAQRHRITYLCHRNPDHDEQSLAIAAMRDVGIEPRIVDRVVPPKSGLSFYVRLAKNLFQSWPYSVATHASLELQHAAEELARFDPPDLWHCEWTPYAETLRKVVTRNDVWVVMAHNVESLIWQRFTETESHPLKRWYLRRQWKKFERFEQWAYQNATSVVAVSPEDAQLIRERFGGKHVEVVDNGVDTTTIVPTPLVKRDPVRLLFLGSLDWRPNLDAVKLLIEEIFPRVKAQEPLAKLIIVGRKPPSWLRDLRSPGVEVHADVPDVKPFLSSAGMMVVPLRIGGGSRLKILEALSAELPVITTTIGVEGLAMKADHEVCVADGTEAFAQAIVRGIRNPTTIQEQAKRGRQRVLESYDWGTLADRLENAWFNAMSNRRPAYDDALAMSQ